MSRERSSGLVPTIRLANGTMLDGGSHVRSQLQMPGGYVEDMQFILMDLQGYDAILGRNWLRQHNPAVDWYRGTVRFTCNQTRHCWQLHFIEVMGERDSHYSGPGTTAPPSRVSQTHSVRADCTAIVGEQESAGSRKERSADSVTLATASPSRVSQTQSVRADCTAIVGERELSEPRRQIPNSTLMISMSGNHLQ